MISAISPSSALHGKSPAPLNLAEIESQSPSIRVLQGGYLTQDEKIKNKEILKLVECLVNCEQQTSPSLTSLCWAEPAPSDRPVSLQSGESCQAAKG